MVEVFKTNITQASEAKRIQSIIENLFPLLHVSFDLEDCDKILRVEGERISTDEIINTVTFNDYQCVVLI